MSMLPAITHLWMFPPPCSERESVKVLILRGFLRRPHSGSEHASEDQNREICRKFEQFAVEMTSEGG